MAKTEFEIFQAIKAAANVLDIPQHEAVKAKVIPHEEVAITQKITFKNFYRAPKFWIAIGSGIAAAATGDYLGAISGIFGLFGLGA